MPITEVSSAAKNETSENPDIDIPASPAILAGDVIICFLWDGAQVTVSEEPAGFTLVCDPLISTIGSPNQLRVYYKVAAGGEEGDNIAWTTQSTYHALGVVVFRGVHGDVFDVTPVHASHHVALQDSTTKEVPDITTITDGAVVVELTGAVSSTTTAISSNDATATEWAKLISMYAMVLGTWVEVGTAGLHSGASHYYTGASWQTDGQGFVMALKPAGAGGGANVGQRGGNMGMMMAMSM